MTDLVRWNPYSELSRMRESIDRIFTPYWGPSVDVTETNGQISVSAEVPGIDPKDINLTISEDGLTISGEIKQDIDVDHQGYRHIERRYGSFHRSIPFPVAVKYDEAVAEYHNGILKVRVPKAATAKSKTLRLQVNPTTPANE
ncbi:MAG: Hsp20/alpha crystallin family protein [Firmicutes bacterium]|nr:Hsp20/alpha crystallin family protein [Bacillota bacterium]